MNVIQFLRFFRHLHFGTLARVIRGVSQRRLTGLSAEIAYNATLALFPALLSVLALFGLFAQFGLFSQGWRETSWRLTSALQDIVPPQVWELLQDFISGIGTQGNGQLFSLSFLASLWITSAAVGAAMNALDEIHQVPSERCRPFWKKRLVALLLALGSVVLFLGASFLLLVSDFLVPAIAQRTGVNALLLLWERASVPAGLGLAAAAFACIYRFGPSERAPETPTLPGALLAALSWVGVSTLFRLYVANFGQYNQIYGAVGAAIVLMLWLYMTALVLLIGDQLNATVGDVIARRERQRRIRAQEQRSRGELSAIDG